MTSALNAARVDIPSNQSTNKKIEKLILNKILIAGG